MAGRFPGAPEIARFWSNLCQGVESVARFTSDELIEAGNDPALVRQPNYVPASAVLADIEFFDADFFGIQRAEAELMDPQHRLLLEVAWEALENAGHEPGRFPGAIGVFVGADAGGYQLGLYRDAELVKRAGAFRLLLANDKDFLATRIAYKLNLRGPAITLQTACSTSLVAVHAACQSLLAGECDMALAGGVSIAVPHKAGYLFHPHAIESPDGHCRAFDASAQGTVGGHGLGLVVLRRLADVESKGDTIRAVIRGSAVNNDGSAKVGFTAPSIQGQTAVIQEALAVADVDPASIGFVEGHGTGTELGDRLEIAALNQAYGTRGEASLGSVKTSIGHLGAAAGIAGLIKTVLALQHGRIPGTLHFQKSHPEHGLEAGRFRVHSDTRPWPVSLGPRRAAVSSFGIGGTNAHVILEEAPAREELAGRPPRLWHLVLLSARSAPALERSAERLASQLEETANTDITDLSYTTQAGRRQFHHGLVVVCRDAGEAGARLRSREPDATIRVRRMPSPPRALLVLPDHSAALLRAGTSLFSAEPAFRHSVERCLETLSAVLPIEICVKTRRHFEESGESTDLDSTPSERVVALITGFAIAQVWIRWGIVPQAFVGEGLGHLAAGCLAGLASFPDVLRLAAGTEFTTVIREQPAPGSPRVPLWLPHREQWSNSDTGADGDWLPPSGERLPLARLPSLLASSTAANLVLDLRPIPSESFSSQHHRSLESDDSARVIQCIPSRVDLKDTPRYLLEALGRFWAAGGVVDWCAFWEGWPARRIALPTYPFERQRFWIQPSGPDRAERPAPASAAPAPDSPVESELRRMIAEIAGLPVEVVSLESKPWELGFDSVNLIQLADGIRTRLGAECDLRRLYDPQISVRALAEWVARKPAEPGRSIQTSLGATSQDRVSPIPSATADAGEPALNLRQRGYLDAFISTYSRHTAASKHHAENGRAHHADNRVPARFHRAWKELIYPIFADAAWGSRIRDLDGREYVDLCMGFGVHLFGHSPSFVVEALHRQLAAGYPLGPHSPLAARVSELITELAPVERVAFCNSGTEAIMAAVRLARTVTGRRLVACFAGSYHGSYDGVLAARAVGNASPQSIPSSLGVPQDIVDPTLVLEYGADESLEILEQHGDELAAVLVEPVQSRRPEFRPREFLGALRGLTHRVGAALVFDEMITGFRVGLGGAQQWYGVQADLVTYGKVIGGGMPIGVVAGGRRFMDPLDGGSWRFGDDSAPGVAQTFFAGTFCKHPLALAAAAATLERLKQDGADLLRTLDARTDRFVGKLNYLFEKHGAPIHATHFASWFIFRPQGKARFVDLFYHQLIARGVYLWEGGTCFLSTAHDDADLELVSKSFEEAISEMHVGGFWNRTVVPGEAVLPLSPGQELIWIQREMVPEAAGAYLESAVVHLRGPLVVERLERALDHLVDAHEALRVTFAQRGASQRVHMRMPWKLETIDASTLAEPDRREAVRRCVDRHASHPFDSQEGPLFRMSLIRESEQRHTLVLSLDHLICDAWSLGVLIRELGARYQALEQDLPLPDCAHTQFRDFIEWQRRWLSSPAAETARAHWSATLHPPPPPLVFERRPRPASPDPTGSRLRKVVPSPVAAAVQRLGRRTGCSEYVCLLGVYAALLHQWTGSGSLVVWISAASQPALGAQDLVGFCVNVLPIASHVERRATFPEFLGRLRENVLQAYRHQHFPPALVAPRKPRFGSTVSDAGQALFNFDRVPARLTFGTLELQCDAGPVHWVRWPLSLNLGEDEGGLVADLSYRHDCLDETEARLRFDQYLFLLASAEECEARTMDDMLERLGAWERERRFELAAERAARVTGPRLEAARRRRPH
jgi:glutamate-1-semialdehyde aminotransferase/3-oxoacyl-(acyl-carrier-protein) synthase